MTLRARCDRVIELLSCAFLMALVVAFAHGPARWERGPCTTSATCIGRPIPNPVPQHAPIEPTNWRH